MTNSEAKQGQRIYFARTKIDQTFRDLKSLLGMSKLMNKQQKKIEKMLALLLLVFAIGLLIREGLRDHWQAIGETALVSFLALDHHPVPTHV